MVPSRLLPILLLTGWSVGAVTTTSTARPSAGEQLETTAPPTHHAIGNQAVPGLSTGVLDANPLSPSPSPEANEADGTEKPVASEAEPAGTPASTAPGSASGSSDPLQKPESAILGGASKVADTHQAAQTATEGGADATSQAPSSSSAFNLLPTGGSGDPSGDVSNFLHGATGLLSPNLLPDLEEVIHDAAHLLKAPTADHTKTLLGSAYDLLNPNTVNKLTSAVHTAEGIITPEVISELKKVHLAEVFNDIGYLYSKGKSLLGSAKGLLSEHVIQDIEDIIDSVKRALSGGSAKDIQDILDKVDGLLPSEVTNSLRTVLSTIGPLVGKSKPFLGRVEHYLSQTDFSRLGDLGKNVEGLIGALASVVTPEHIKEIEDAFDKAKPYVGKVQGYLSHADWNRVGALAKNVEGLISTLASAVTPEHIKQIENAAAKAKPYTQKVWNYLSHADWNRVGDLVNNVEDLIGSIASVVTPENIKKLEGAFNNVKSYLTPATMDKARGLVASVWSNLTPEGINRVGSLLGKANALLTPGFFDQVSNVFSKLGILYNSIAPGITPPTFDRLGGLLDAALELLTPTFANETSSLIGTASGVLTPQLVNKVDGIVHSAERMFTPQVRNDTVSVLGSAAHVSSAPLSNCEHGRLKHPSFQIVPNIASFIQSL